MSKKTVLNDNYKGVVEVMSIPAELHRGSNGKKYATFGTTVPIHVCTQEQVEKLAPKTHHVCDIFTEQVFAQLGEIAFVRIDENTAEKVFINRSKRLLVTSSDGRLAQWRCAPTFESSNAFVAGAPLVTAAGELVSVVTAKRGNNYAVSNFEGNGGYFDTTQPWKVMNIPDGHSVYGDRSFPSRESLREYVSSLSPGAELSPALPPAPVLHVGGAGAGGALRHAGAVSRVALVAHNGRQISHTYVHGVIATDLEYL